MNADSLPSGLIFWWHRLWTQSFWIACLGCLSVSQCSKQWGIFKTENSLCPQLRSQLSSGYATCTWVNQPCFSLSVPVHDECLVWMNNRLLCSCLLQWCVVFGLCSLWALHPATPGTYPSLLSLSAYHGFWLWASLQILLMNHCMKYLLLLSYCSARYCTVVEWWRPSIFSWVKLSSVYFLCPVPGIQLEEPDS